MYRKVPRQPKHGYRAQIACWATGPSRRGVAISRASFGYRDIYTRERGYAGLDTVVWLIRHWFHIRLALIFLPRAPLIPEVLLVTWYLDFLRASLTSPGRTEKRFAPRGSFLLLSLPLDTGSLISLVSRGILACSRFWVSCRWSRPLTRRIAKMEAIKTLLIANRGEIAVSNKKFTGAQ